MQVPVAIPIAVRGYLVRAKTAKRPPRDETFEPKSPWTLVFDTETDTGEYPAAQPVLTVQYHVYYEQALFQRGIAYDPEALWHGEIDTIRHFCVANEYYAVTVAEFRQLFYKFAHGLHASVVAANLFFDLTRLAIDHTRAQRRMLGGFSFALSSDPFEPNVRAKKITDVAYRFDFAGVPTAQTRALRRQRNGKKQRKAHRDSHAKKTRTLSPWRGDFVDVLVAGKALLGEGRPSLETLGRRLRVEHPKLETPEFTRPITEEQLRYAVRDPLTTAECYFKLQREYGTLELPKPLNEIYSEASVSKAYLEKMGVVPWMRMQADFDPEVIGYLMAGYAAGRCDTKIRRKIRRVVYCDFTSLYPVGCVLQSLWKYIIARGVSYREATIEVQAFLDEVSLEDLQKPATWQRLVGIAQVEAQGDVLPIRGDYGRRPGRRIGWNHFSQGNDDHLLWFTLADLIASKLLTGKTPKVVRAFRFAPLEPQEGLKTIKLGEKTGFNPYTDDFFKLVIEQRLTATARATEARRAGDEQLFEQLDGTQRHLKGVANSIYGFFEEQNIEERVRAIEHEVYSLRGKETRNRWLHTIERPGKYFHPLLGTCITSAAHLFLAIAELLAGQEGVEWMLCDTDSMAFARPDGMQDSVFLSKVEKIRAWFAPLNPFDGLPTGEFFKRESVNFESDGQTPRELSCLAVAPKSYCLFTLDAKGNPIIGEGKQHGLGHLLPPYLRSDEEEKACMKSTKLRCWQRDVWGLVVRAHLKGHPDQVDCSVLDNFSSPAAHRFTVSTLKTEEDCRFYNAGKPYRERIRPGGFLLSFPAKNPARLQAESGRATDRKNTRASISPYAPYDRNPNVAAKKCFDRKTGRAVSVDELQTYAETLRYFHLRPEDKYDNAKFLDSGTTERKHIIPLWIDVIGKETRRFSTEDPYVFDAEYKPTEYGSIPSRTYLEYAARILGARLNTRHEYSRKQLLEIEARVEERLELDEADRFLIERVRVACKVCGSLRKFAQIAGIDAGDLSKVSRGKRPLTKILRRMLAQALEQ